MHGSGDAFRQALRVLGRHGTLEWQRAEHDGELWRKELAPGDRAPSYRAFRLHRETTDVGEVAPHLCELAEALEGGRPDVEALP